MPHDFITFIIAHWELSLAFVLILIYWIGAEIIEFLSTTGISPSHLVHLMNKENAIIIDIREAQPYEQGHILGALSYPEKTLFSQLDGLKRYQSGYLVLVDANGSQSNKIINKLIAKGFEKAHYLKGGLGAWRHEKLPLETTASNPSKKTAKLLTDKSGKSEKNGKN